MKKIAFLVVTILIFLFIVFSIYRSVAYTHITVKFKELRPMHQKLPVYYKGIKIGETAEKQHSDDYQHTLVNIVLFPKKLNLPENVRVLLKNEKRNGKDIDYLEIIYPKEPSTQNLSNGATIEGKSTIDFNSFIGNQNPEDLESVRINIAQSSENLNNALEGLSIVFASLDEILKENQKNIYDSSSNLSKTTKNLEQITTKFDVALKQEKLNDTINNLDNSFKNVEKATSSLQTMSNNFNDASSSINTNTLPQIQATLYQTECLVANANEIAGGIKNTLKKRFSGFRFMFGRVIEEKDKTDNCESCE